MTSPRIIVIIENDSETADLYRKEIEVRKIGVVDVVNDAAELITVDQLQTRLGHASVVVLDIVMELPEGMSGDGTEGGLFTGCKIHKSIQDHFPNLPVICLTNLSPSYVDVAAKQLGVPSAHIYSKFDMTPERLATFLESLLP